MNSQGYSQSYGNAGAYSTQMPQGNTQMGYSNSANAPYASYHTATASSYPAGQNQPSGTYQGYSQVPGQGTYSTNTTPNQGGNQPSVPSVSYQGNGGYVSGNPVTGYSSGTAPSAQAYGERVPPQMGTTGRSGIESAQRYIPTGTSPVGDFPHGISTVYNVGNVPAFMAAPEVRISPSDLSKWAVQPSAAKNGPTN